MTEPVVFLNGRLVPAAQAHLNVLYNEQDLAFPITIKAEASTPISELLAALAQVLRAHGLNLTEEGAGRVWHRRND